MKNLYCLSTFASPNARIELTDSHTRNYVWITFIQTNDRGEEIRFEPIKVLRTALMEALS